MEAEFMSRSTFRGSGKNLLEKWFYSGQLQSCDGKPDADLLIRAVQQVTVPLYQLRNRTPQSDHESQQGAE